MIRRILTNSIVKMIGMILFTIFFVIYTYWFVLNGLKWALQYRWLLPFVVIISIGSAVFLGRQDLKTQQANGFDLRKGLTIFLMMILITAIGFGALSLWLATEGWANYSTANLDLVSYSNYYLWLFLDMIPLLKVNETLGLVAPIKPVGFVAGLPVLAFRALVLFVLLKSLKEWWNSRNEKNDSRTKSQSPISVISP